MLALLLSYLAKPKVLIGLSVMIVVLSGFFWYGAQREKAGYQHGSVAQLETDKQQFEQVAKQYQDALTKAQSTIDSSNAKIAALDLASNYDELSTVLRPKLNEDFRPFGIELTKFIIENISLPPEVEAAMDRRTSMGVLGDAGRYTQFQAADAMRAAAENPGGGAGTGAGLGAGFAIGNAMAGAMANAMNPQNAQSGQGGAPAAATVKCPKCGSANNPASKFCHDCGAELRVEQRTVPCVKCGNQLAEGAKFCNECGAKQEKAKCPNCQAEVGPGAKFCNECGTKIETSSAS